MTRLGSAVFWWLLLMSPPVAAQENQLTLHIYIDKLSDAKRIFVTRQGFDIPVTGDVVDGRFEFRIDAVAVKERTSFVSVYWNDGQVSTFPVSLSSAFVNQPIQVFVFSEGEAPADGCPDNPAGSSVAEAFRLYFSCKRAVSQLDDAGREWTPSFNGALNSLRISEYYLATIMYPSPYRIDSELVDRLMEVKNKINEGYKESDFKPLKLTQLEEALDFAANQELSYAPAVERLARDGNPNARKVNSVLLEWLQQDPAAAKGVAPDLTLDRLEANQTYLESLF